MLVYFVPFELQNSMEKPKFNIRQNRPLERLKDQPIYQTNPVNLSLPFFSSILAKRKAIHAL